MPKVSLRDRLLKQRQSLSLQDCERLSLRAQENLLATPEFAAARRVALYSPIRNEVRTEQLFAAAKRARKQVVFPRMQGDHLEFFPVASLDELRRGTMGVLEPHGGIEVALPDLDLMVLPGVGFDLQGHRLGYGRGFYDRVLGATPRRPLLVGLGFELQVVEQLPRESHDVQIDLMVSEVHVRRHLAGELTSTNLSQKGRV
ncbi:MAG: 5-formyltetrahydrofolate cyclo-ligase [Desulfuromonas sp.]|nr:MAG: 5-formyltetrahydrofolate cyclo-ligase [Desulfuromonas sp.]